MMPADVRLARAAPRKSGHVLPAGRPWPGCIFRVGHATLRRGGEIRSSEAVGEAEVDRGMGASETRRHARSGAAPRDVIRSALLATVALVMIGSGAGRAETMNGALVKAYLTNPDINSQRATVRATDESVPEANAGYLPKISAVGTAGVQHANGNTVNPGSPEYKYATG